MSHPALPAAALVVVWLVATTLGPTSVAEPSDLPIYRGYADALRAGQVPYRDFALEYPPLALAPIGLGAALGAGAPVYAWAFGGLMLLCALVVQAAAAALAGRHGRAVAWSLVLLPVALGAIVRARFDLFPVALTLVALVALLVHDRPRAAFVLLGLGTAAKLFPAVVAAAALAYLVGAGRRDEARDGLVAFAVTLAVVCLPFLLASPDGFAAQFAFHLDRPVQIESTPATVLWALGDSFVTGFPVRPDRFKSNGLDGGPAGGVALVFAALQVAAVAAAVALAARAPTEPRRLILASFAGLLAFVALGKVLSPQFLLWLAPPAAVAWAHGARLPALLVGVAIVLTQVEFPARYERLLDGEAWVVGLVAVRNVLLLAALGLTLAALAAPARSRRRSAPSSRTG